jgi:hypothetical protein
MVGGGEETMALTMVASARPHRLRGGGGRGVAQRSFELSSDGDVVHHQDPFFGRGLVL